jgi:hypothetical protein
MGSAIRVLLEHYCTGMVLDTLDFSEVQWDDVLVAEDDCYVDIPRDLLPEPAGEDLWWQKLPPSGKRLQFSLEFVCTHHFWVPSLFEGLTSLSEFIIKYSNPD